MMEEMSVQANTNAVLMSNIQVMALGNPVGDDIMVQTTALQVSGQTINGRATLDDACTTADLHFTDAAGDDYTVSLIPQGSSSVGPAVDFGESRGLRYPAGRLRRLGGHQHRGRRGAD